MSNDQLGILGSLVYAGIGIVSIFVGKLFMHYDPSRLVLFSLVGMVSTLILFTVDYGVVYPYYILRFLTGAFQVTNRMELQAPLLIYFPVWVDHFGGKSKTIWLTLL